MEVLKELDIDKLAATPMNFVMGMGRSGTTLLQVMLNAHPNIVAPPESRFVIRLHSKYGHITHWTEKVITQFCDDLYIETLFREFWRINKKELHSIITTYRNKLSYPILCKLIYYLMAEPGKDVKMFFDKNPIYYFFLPEIGSLFPSAKYVHIVRDYRDSILSHQQVLTIKSPADLAYRWLKVNRMMEEIKTGYKGKCITIKYEALVTEPVIVMQEICNFIGVTFTENMVKDISTKLPEVFYMQADKEPFKKFHVNLFQPVNRDQIGKWKNRMPEKQVRVTEDIAGEYGYKMYGYEISSPPPHKVKGIGLLRLKIRYTVFKFLYRIVLKHSLFFKSGRMIWGFFFERNHKQAGR